LGVAGPQDAIDFTDNDIATIGNFPLSPRLSTLLFARNRITQIQPNLAASIPNLTTLVLTSNNIAELADLDPLRKFTKLTHVTLLENPVTRKEVWPKPLTYSQEEISVNLELELPILAYLAHTHHPIP
jgi:U2 small nuclear ribonucleoprotein A'